MKISMFHLCPYRKPAGGLREKYHSVWVDVPRHLYDPETGAQIYNDTLDELEFASRAGYDGVCVNEHHQNAYGLMPSPNIMAAALARSTKDVALIVMGNSIALYDPPTRVAEEIAMLDGISGGRIVSGFPVGTSMDSNYCYGANPATFREKYYEAEELIIRAWTEEEMFAFDGKYTQLRYVNLWPKPLQQPHPPVWIPGGGSIETWGWTVDKGYLYAYLSYSGFKRGKQVMDGFWKIVDEKGVEPNPYRAGFLQLVCVADSEQEAEERYGPAAEYFYNKMLHVYPGFADAPGYRTLATIKAGLLAQTTRFGRDGVGELKWKDIVEAGNVVAGTPDQVTEQLEQVATDLRVGHLMLLNQIGSMPHELAMYNIEKTATEVVPNLRHLWSDYEDHWWPQNAIVREPAAAAV